MTKSEVKGYFYSIKSEITEIKELKGRIEELEVLATGMHGIAYDKDKVQTSPDGDVMSSKLIKVEEYRDKLKDKVEHLNQRRIQAQDMIDRLDDSRERQVLDLFFLSDQQNGMHQVAQMMHYSERETYLIYQLAIEHVASNSCSDLQCSSAI